MSFNRKQGSAGRAIMTIAAAGLFLLQTMVAGMAASASFSGDNAGFLNLVCSSAKADAASKGDPQAPVRHHTGACCILHDEAAVEPDAGPATVSILASTPPTIIALPANSGRAIHDAPEMGPRSARAPPARIV
ncbi:MAG: hypothetical protein F9K41_17375 [Sphingopyxis terrae]|nr:MAG: hypothetical protein F9K41_17375 [Sphingopyxis terrae]